MRFSERNVKISLFVFIFVIFFLAGFLSPQWEKVKSLRRALAKGENSLEEMRTLSHLVSKSTLEKTSEGSLFSLVEDIAKISGLSGKIEFIKPLTGKEKEGVEVRISSVRMNELVKFLYSLEKTHNLQILEGKIEKNKDGRTLNVQLSLR